MWLTWSPYYLPQKAPFSSLGSFKLSCSTSSRSSLSSFCWFSVRLGYIEVCVNDEWANFSALLRTFVIWGRFEWKKKRLWLRRDGRLFSLISKWPKSGNRMYSINLKVRYLNSSFIRYMPLYWQNYVPFCLRECYWTIPWDCKWPDWLYVSLAPESLLILLF